MTDFFSLLRCPVTHSRLQLKVISRGRIGKLNDQVLEGILYSDADWIYPVIGGIPRMLVEAFLDYEDFLKRNMDDYEIRKSSLLKVQPDLMKNVIQKNRRTKESFALEWGVFRYETDKTWDADPESMLKRFMIETGETEQQVSSSLILDAGCGNGLLDNLLGELSAKVVAMDLSRSIERAKEKSETENVFFVQGDVQYPPFEFESFDLVHSSGVLHHTTNTELSFSALNGCLRKGGKMSIWLYQPGKKLLHHTFNLSRKLIGWMPVRFQYYLLLFTVLPISFVIKKLKGNKQNSREMFIDILDWFTPEFRWEHKPEEVAAWMEKRNYHSIKVTTSNDFGFNITGIRQV